MKDSLVNSSVTLDCNLVMSVNTTDWLVNMMVMLDCIPDLLVNILVKLVNMSDSSVCILDCTSDFVVCLEFLVHMQVTQENSLATLTNALVMVYMEMQDSLAQVTEPDSKLGCIQVKIRMHPIVQERMLQHLVSYRIRTQE